MLERLQKIIARAGIASRRAAEKLVTSGRVRVNGRVVTELGAKADQRTDKVEVDGQRLIAEEFQYVVLHKPRNVVSTLSDPEGRPTVATLLKDAGARLYPVGRLDFSTSGVLLATNDGDFANGLLHPRGGVPKTYVLKVSGVMQEADLERWRTGVRLEDGMTLPAEVRLIRHEGDKSWIEVTLREGRNQQIRRMGEATRFLVMRLARISFAGVTHEDLRPGSWRPLTVEELNDIKKQFGVPKKVRRPAPIPVAATNERRTRAPRPDHRAESSERRPERGDRPASGGNARPSARNARPGDRNARTGERNAPAGARNARPGERNARPGERNAPTGERNARNAQPGASNPRSGANDRAETRPKFERSGRSGTTPRGAGKPDPRARGRAGR
jgi:23S rRNA pseudouridine2605 synthase